MEHLAPLIYDLAVMLGVAALVVLIFQRIHQPIVLGYLIAGLIIGPHTPPYTLIIDIKNIQILSQLGVIFLMFALGLEFSFHKLTKVGFSASVTGFIEVVLMTAVGFVAGQLLGWDYYNSLFLGAALSISSTTIIIKAIDELNLKTKRFAELIFGILVVEDLLAILLLVGLSTIVVTQNILSLNMLFAVIKLILVVGSWFIFGYFLVPPVFRSIARYINAETLTIVSVALCLMLVSIAASFNYSAALGAFIMGSILAETVLVRRIEHLILPIRDIFAAVFFISVGMLIDPMEIIHNWDIVIFLSLVTVIGKILTTSTAALLTGQSLNTSVRVGFGMAQVGEFSFIIAALGVTLGVTSSELYPLIVAVSVVTTFTTPYLIRLSGTVGSALEKALPERTRYFLKSYSSWVFRSQAIAKQNSALSTVTMRLIVNGIVVAVIFSLIHYIAFYQLKVSKASIMMNNICLLTSLILCSPFVWGMLFAYRKVKMPVYAENTLNPAIFIIWLLTLVEVSVLSLVYFHSWTIVAIFLSIAFVFILLAYRHLERSYHWFEKQLVNNLKASNPKNERMEELAPWDTHLVELVVGEHSALAGQTLSEAKIRELYGVNIVAIAHGARVIPAPRGEERIVEHDKLIVLGNDDQLEAFVAKLESTAEVKDEAASLLENFTLRAVLLEEDNKLLGKTIRESHLREKFHSLVVGIERNNMRILNPPPDTILELDDLLLLVGETKRVRARIK